MQYAVPTDAPPRPGESAVWRAVRYDDYAAAPRAPRGSSSRTDSSSSSRCGEGSCTRGGRGKEDEEMPFCCSVLRHEQAATIAETRMQRLPRQDEYWGSPYGIFLLGSGLPPLPREEGGGGGPVAASSFSLPFSSRQREGLLGTVLHRLLAHTPSPLQRLLGHASRNSSSSSAAEHYSSTDTGERETADSGEKKRSSSSSHAGRDTSAGRGAGAAAADDDAAAAGAKDCIGWRRIVGRPCSVGRSDSTAAGRESQSSPGGAVGGAAAAGRAAVGSGSREEGKGGAACSSGAAGGGSRGEMQEGAARRRSSSSSGGQQQEERAEFIYLSYTAVDEYIRLLGSGLAQLLQRKAITTEWLDDETANGGCFTNVGLLLSSRPEWLLFDLALAAYPPFTSITLHYTFPPSFIQSVLEEARVSCVVTDDAKLPVLLQLTEQLPALKTVIVVSSRSLVSMQPPSQQQQQAQQQQQRQGQQEEQQVWWWGEDKREETLKESFAVAGVQLLQFEEVVTLGRGHPRCPIVYQDPSRIFSIMYTSGTTGPPKGVMLSIQGWLSMVRAVVVQNEDLLQVDAACTHICYLPLSHVLERLVDYLALSCGARIGFYSGVKEKLAEDWAAAEPSHLVIVPKLASVMLHKIEKRIDALPFFKSMLVKAALAQKLHSAAHSSSSINSSSSTTRAALATMAPGEESTPPSPSSTGLQQQGRIRKRNSSSSGSGSSKGEEETERGGGGEAEEDDKGGGDAAGGGVLKKRRKRGTNSSSSKSERRTSSTTSSSAGVGRSSSFSSSSSSLTSAGARLVSRLWGWGGGGGAAAEEEEGKKGEEDGRRGERRYAAAQLERGFLYDDVLHAGQVMQQRLFGRGAHVRFVAVGGGKLDGAVQQRLRCLLDVPVIQGWGMTEICGIGSIQPHKTDASLDNVGCPAASIELKLRSWGTYNANPQAAAAAAAASGKKAAEEKKGGENSSSSGRGGGGTGDEAVAAEEEGERGRSRSSSSEEVLLPRGELLVRGDSMFVGYFRNKQLTQESFVWDDVEEAEGHEIAAAASGSRENEEAEETDEGDNRGAAGAAARGRGGEGKGGGGKEEEEAAGRARRESSGSPVMMSHSRERRTSSSRSGGSSSSNSRKKRGGGEGGLWDGLPWLATGDIAEIQPNGSLKIIDRKKSLIKLAQGEYLQTEKLECLYSSSRFVEHIFVHGYDSQSYPVAVIHPDLRAVLFWAQGHKQQKSDEQPAAAAVPERFSRRRRSSSTGSGGSTTSRNSSSSQGSSPRTPSPQCGVSTEDEEQQQKRSQQSVATGEKQQPQQEEEEQAPEKQQEQQQQQHHHHHRHHQQQQQSHQGENAFAGTSQETKDSCQEIDSSSSSSNSSSSSKTEGNMLELDAEAIARVKRTLADPSFKAAVLTDLNRIATEKSLMGFEKIKNVYFTLDVWSVENGMLTPTMKIKRSVLLQRYKHHIDELYAELARSSRSSRLWRSSSSSSSSSFAYAPLQRSANVVYEYMKRLLYFFASVMHELVQRCSHRASAAGILR